MEHAIKVRLVRGRMQRGSHPDNFVTSKLMYILKILQLLFHQLMNKTYLGKESNGEQWHYTSVIILYA